MAALPQPGNEGLPAFDDANPQAFYLRESWEEMASLSDAVLVAAGVRLPVHSQVLSLQSSVLRGLFVEFLGTDNNRYGDSPVGGKRKIVGEYDKLVLGDPFSGSSLFEAALFLRLCYRPRDVNPANLAAQRASLPALLALAHKLDAPRILTAVVAHMAEAPIRGTEEAATWIEAAEQCHQPDLQLACVSRLVQRLLGKEPGPAALASSIADAAQLKRIDKSTLLLLLGLVAGSARQLVPREQLLAYAAPSREDIAAAQQQATGVGSLEWRIERFSQMGSKLLSPSFVAGGKEWQLVLYPNGNGHANEGHLSVFVVPKSGQDEAAAAFTLCDQTAAHPVHFGASFERRMVQAEGWGFLRFISLPRLRARPGYLAGDSLLIRAEVHVPL